MVFRTVCGQSGTFPSHPSPSLELKREKEGSALTDRLSFYLSVRRCAVHNEGVFAYPFLTIAPPVVRASIYACATAGALSLFWVLNGLKSRK